MRTFVAIAIACCALASGARSQVIITRNNSQPSSTGSADNFTGTVRVSGFFQRTAPARVSGATVTFEPGARTVWHVHPLGQTLIVTAGTGRVQRWGDPVDEMRQGDVVWIPPGQKHWHGAGPNSSMTHIAITEQLDGKTVEWMEKVSDAQYGAPLRRVRLRTPAHGPGRLKVQSATSHPSWLRSQTTCCMATSGNVRSCPSGIAAWQPWQR